MGEAYQKGYKARNKPTNYHNTDDRGCNTLPYVSCYTIAEKVKNSFHIMISLLSSYLYRQEGKKVKVHKKKGTRFQVPFPTREREF